MRTWTEADFEQWSWHDCHVHGLSITEGEHGCGELILDVDFITEWDKQAGGSFLFHVAPATLVFHDISGLVINLDYARSAMAMGPFPIDGIEREPIVTPHQLLDRAQRGGA